MGSVKQLFYLFRSLSILSPKEKNLPVQEAREVWRFLAESFPNIVAEIDLDRLLYSELPKYTTIEDPEEGIQVDEWWARVADVEICEEKFFKHLSHLALGLSTIYNSSSEVERDFSKINLVYAGNRKDSITQTKLQNKLCIQAAVSEEGKSCKRCIENEEVRDKKMKDGGVVGRRQVNHCHCSFIDPDPEVLSDLKSGGPGHRFNLKMKADESKDRNKNDKENKRKEDVEAAKIDLKKEVAKLKRKVMEKAVKAAQDKTHNEQEKSKSSSRQKSSKRKAKIEKTDLVAKRKRLCFDEN